MAKKKKEVVVVDMPVPTGDSPIHLYEVKMVVAAKRGAGIAAVLEHVQVAVAVTGVGVVLDKGNAIKLLTRGGHKHMSGRIISTGFDQYKITPKDTVLKVVKLADMKTEEVKAAEPPKPKEKPLKLTGQQVETLMASAKKGGTYAVNYYPPVKKLYELGFVDNGGEMRSNQSHQTWHITAKGSAWLQAYEARKKKS